MSTFGSYSEITSCAAADLVLLDHSYAALVVPLPDATPAIPPVSDSPDTTLQLPIMTPVELETPLDRGLRHADGFYKRLVRESSQKQVWLATIVCLIIICLSPTVNVIFCLDFLLLCFCQILA